jgi:hypothetical protein
MMPQCHHDGMKKRMQIQLDPEDLRALRGWAKAAGVSLSGAVRMLIRERLHGAARPRSDAVARFLDAAGSVREQGDATDVSRAHDEYLYGRKET